MNADLITGWQLHQAGRFADAARRYHTLLARNPTTRTPCTYSGCCTTRMAILPGPSS